MAHLDLGVKLMERLMADLVEISVIEQRPKMEGRQMVMVLGPKKAK